jgi:hypothetical protein
MGILPIHQSKGSRMPIKVYGVVYPKFKGTLWLASKKDMLAQSEAKTQSVISFGWTVL